MGQCLYIGFHGKFECFGQKINGNKSCLNEYKIYE